MKMLYKYRSTNEFKYFMDILINKRLWAAEYHKLNDPMEGIYTYNKGNFDKKLRRKLRGQKENLKICSLSKSEDNMLMWSHYADSHRGVVIGLTINEEEYTISEISYKDKLEEITNDNYNYETARQILTRKLKPWEYEEEVRLFVNGKNYVENIKIHKIICGSKMNRITDFPLIKKIVNRIDPTIEVFQKSKIVDEED